jgi:hypothetical protein
MSGIQHAYLIERAKQDGWQTTMPWKPAFRTLALTHAREQGNEYDGISLCDELAEFRRVPDAWRVVTEQDPGCDKLLVLELLEVDVSSPVTEAKLEDYDNIWWAFDGSGYFELRVYRMDKTGAVSLLVSEESAPDRSSLRWRRAREAGEPGDSPAG